MKMCEWRTNEVLRIMDESPEPMTAKQISNLYVDNSTTSDHGTTGVICNVLTASKILRRGEKLRGRRAFIVTYQMTPFGKKFYKGMTE